MESREIAIWIKNSDKTRIFTCCLVLFFVYFTATSLFAAEVKGTVIMVKGNDVTIQLDEKGFVKKGDKVEIYWDSEGIPIPYGTWRVSLVKDDGIIEAEPDKIEGTPTPKLKATIHAIGSAADRLTDKPVVESGGVDSGTKDSKRGTSSGQLSPTLKAFAIYDQMEISRQEKACSNGDAQSCKLLGWRYRKGDGVPMDYRRAIELLEKGCGGGDPTGCNRLGIMYAEGIGVDKNLVKAVELYDKACDGGESVGCRNAGNKYRLGIGVDKNYRLAVKYYEKSCNRGNGDLIGCNNLGLMYKKGNGVAQDYSRAAQLYEKACKGGVAMSCSNLGTLYEYGDGVAQDERRAVELYRKGCDGENALSYGYLGWMYYKGRGISPDRDRGLELMKKSCAMGAQWSCEELAKIK